LASYPSEKLEDFEIVDMMKARLREMADLPIQPDYYYKVKDLIYG